MVYVSLKVLLHEDLMGRRSLVIRTLDVDDVDAWRHVSGVQLHLLLSGGNNDAVDHLPCTIHHLKFTGLARNIVQLYSHHLMAFWHTRHDVHSLDSLHLLHGTRLFIYAVDECKVFCECY